MKNPTLGQVLAVEKVLQNANRPLTRQDILEILMAESSIS